MGMRRSSVKGLLDLGWGICNGVKGLNAGEEGMWSQSTVLCFSGNGISSQSTVRYLLGGNGSIGFYMQCLHDVVAQRVIRA